ncbi:uncharacterized protein AMSG_04854 [Thecamonas trahens ATCC 50062]|uniref:DAGKc domain-containing protein n=1 Tax=Thecamonas trahens ATCC 50062 TaxID=461836 RepID=A0A0L0D845_THETB|nr:hypothetical protein AMSG_04854 [Thecamonas trahens ATCC 50062]KNC48405.1 hypothetical protein AMSG_04854 [Thecamonas trahens ATCC 50062]|eukprot:XP_013758522.1 hypothetical protein AMSG_04854 [Thecamonas trahens ATCC 50062]
MYIVYWFYAAWHAAKEYYGIQVRLREMLESPVLVGGDGPWRGKSIAVVLNPVSGAGTAEAVFDSLVVPLMTMAGVEHSLMTTRAASDMTRVIAEVNWENFDALMVCGGDGTFNEAINALRELAPGLETKLPLMLLPMGTSNGLVRSHGDASVLEAAFRALTSLPLPTDAWDVRIVPFAPGAEPVDRIDAFMMSWAMVAEHDDYQERKFRWMGPTLASLAAPLVTIAGMRHYEGTISFLPAPAAHARAVAAGHDYYVDPATLPAVAPPEWHRLHADSPPDSDAQATWRTIPTPVVLCTAVNVAWQAADIQFSPGAVADDGALDVCILGSGASRLGALRIFISIESGRHVTYPHTLFAKASALHIVPASPSRLSLSGETLPFGEIRIVVRPSHLHMVR